MYGILATDGYKLFHGDAYDEEITHVYSNMTSRNGRLSNIKDNEKVVFIGLQGFILDFILGEFEENFFQKDKEEAVKDFKRVVDSYLGGNYDTSRIESLWDLGYLPISIKALPEGSLVPYNVPAMVFENTVGGFEWVTNYLETVISSELWQMQTSATSSVAYYKTFKEAYQKTGLPLEGIPFMGHDFSFRGMAGRHAAAASGFGHLASGFVGTDTLPAILYAEKYYGADVDNELVGCSVPATEHSTMTSSILKKVKEGNLSYQEAELETFRELMRKVPTGILSVVSDSFDFWSVVGEILPNLKDEIMAREGTLVIRPDSGDPVEVLCGMTMPHTTINYSSEEEAIQDAPYQVETDGVMMINNMWYRCGWTTEDDFEIFNPVSELETKGLIEALWDTFGGTLTEEGYKVLDSHIGAIYGDSITHERQQEICNRLIAKGFAPTVVLGIGSYTFQYVTRDTHGSAVKATNVTAKGEDIAICKDPKTDTKKKSAKGLLRVEEENGTLVLYDNQTREEAEGGLLQEVFRDGELTKETTLAEIRERIQGQI